VRIDRQCNLQWQVILGRVLAKARPPGLYEHKYPIISGVKLTVMAEIGTAFSAVVGSCKSQCCVRYV
jgi:hypothetical protein